MHTDRRKRYREISCDTFVLPPLLLPPLSWLLPLWALLLLLSFRDYLPLSLRLSYYYRYSTSSTTITTITNTITIITIITLSLINVSPRINIYSPRDGRVMTRGTFAGADKTTERSESLKNREKKKRISEGGWRRIFIVREPTGAVTRIG